MNPPNPPVESAKDAIEQNLSEEGYLRCQADIAKQELSASFATLIRRLSEAKDIKRWARRYPFPTVGAAAAAGFTAATIVTPSKNETMQDKLSRFGNHVNRLMPQNGEDPAAKASEATAKSSAPVAVMAIINTFFNLAKVLIERTATPPTQRNAAVPPQSSCAPPHHHAHD